MEKKHSIIKSFTYAFQGIKTTLKREPNFKIQMLIGLLAIIAGFVLNLSNIEWAILIVTIFMVLVFELINTTLETLVDLISPNYSEGAKIIKDVAAAAVLISSILSIIVGLLIFLPKIVLE